MKLVDFDGMFDKKLSAFVKKNAGKFTAEQLEDMIPSLYSKFGDTAISSLGASPRGYYAAMSDEELVKCLCAHEKNGVPVSAFLARELEGRPACRAALIAMLPSADGRLARRIVAVLGGVSEAIPAYMSLLTACGEDDDDLKESLADFIKENADLVKEQAIANYRAGTERPLMLEVLSCVRVHDDRIFDILISEFRGAGDTQMLAGYLASYGDERALPYLLDRIAGDVPYIEFQELKYAIEALGGEYSEQRDFSGDKAYELIHAHTAADDIFAVFNKNAEGADEKK